MALTKINAKQIDAFGSSSAAQVEVDRHMDMNSNDLVGINDLTASAAKVDNDMLVGGNVEIMGDLTVQGGQLIANVSILEVEDLAIRAARTAASSATMNGAGLQIGQSGSAFEESILWNHAQDRWDVSAELSASALRGTIDAAALDLVSTSDLAEGTKLYFTDARVHAAVSAVDSGGDGSFSETDGVFTYVGPSALEARAHFSGAAGIDITDGDVSVRVDDSGIEIFEDKLRIKADGIKDSHIDWGTDAGQVNTDDMTEGSTNQYWTNTRSRLDHTVSNSIVDGRRGTLSYDNATGEFSFEGVSQVEIRADISASMSANSGRGSVEYNQTTGVISYEGVTQAEIRSDFGVVDTNSIDMGYDVLTGAFSGSVIVDTGMEVTATGLRIAAGAAGDGLAWNNGVLSSTRSELTSGSMVVADDQISYIDEASGLEKKESWADAMASSAGNGLSDAAGQMRLDISDCSTSFTSGADMHGSDVFGLYDISASEQKKVTLSTLGIKLADSGLSSSNGRLSVAAKRDTFTGDPVDGGYTLASTVSVAESVQVFLNGQLLRDGAGNDYTFGANKITLDANLALDATDELMVHYLA
jgi:phage baseplate assembly protein gpV